MNPVAWNALLALAWLAITGSFTPANFALGMGVGFIALIVAQRIPGVPRYTRRTWDVVLLGLFFVREILLANVRVTRDILFIERTRPALIDVPIRSRRDSEITVLTALIILTPGSTVVDISPDGTRILVHVTNLPPGGVEQARRDILEGFERRVLAAMR